ncbi:hypothetical protein Mapa_002427 [Marchantia paleacea]|nr:hypothetical protein Mapa_002427 [Marchantia paleacea]
MPGPPSGPGTKGSDCHNFTSSFMGGRLFRNHSGGGLLPEESRRGQILLYVRIIPGIRPKLLLVIILLQPFLPSLGSIIPRLPRAVGGSCFISQSCNVLLAKTAPPVLCSRAGQR